MLTWGSVGVPLLKVRCSEGVESYLDDTSRVFVLSLSGFRIYALWLMLPREVLFLIVFFFTFCYWIWDVKPNHIWTFYLWFVILVQFLAVYRNVKELLVKMPADTIDAYSLLHSVFANTRKTKVYVTLLSKNWTISSFRRENEVLLLHGPLRMQELWMLSVTCHSFLKYIYM